MGLLCELLVDNDRPSEIALANKDEAYKEKLLKEFGIIE